MDTKKPNKLAVFLIFFAVFSVAFYVSFSYLDSDFGWHLKLGQDISQDRDVPRFNTYNIVLENVSLVDHEWLSNFFIYLIYDNFGYFLLTLSSCDA